MPRKRKYANPEQKIRDDENQGEIEMTEVKNLVLAIATVAGSNGLPVTEIDKIVNDWLKEGYTVFSCNTAGVIGATVVIHILLVK